MNADDVCSRPGCGKPVKALGLCATDYMRAYRHGTLPPKTQAATCSVEDCPFPVEARGLCARHYSRYYLRGTIELTEPQRRLPPAERFRFYVSEAPCACGHGCLRWKGGKNGAGYGLFYVDGGKVAAHRFAYVLDGNEIPPEYHVDHVRSRGCRHRDCVNPAHLEAVTLEENLKRAPAGRRSENGKRQKELFAVHRVERFWVKVDRTGGPDAHWPWLAFIDDGGNAKAWWNSRTYMAREVAWEVTHGEVPAGQIPLQECGRGDCMNPAHMVLVDRKADQARRAALAREGKRRNEAETLPGPRGARGLQRTEEFREKMRVAGRKGAEARWHPAAAPDGEPEDPAPSSR